LLSFSRFLFLFALFPLASQGGDHVIKLDGRDLILAKAVDRSEAGRLADANLKQKGDKRNLYLAREGVINPGTAAAHDVSKADLEKRQRAWKVRFYHISLHSQSC